MNEHNIINYFSNLSFNDFKNIDEIEKLEIEESQLKIIYKVIIDNLFALIDSHYHQVIINLIKKKTSYTTCLKFENVLRNNYFSVLSNA